MMVSNTTDSTKYIGRTVRLEFSTKFFCPVNWSVPVIISDEEAHSYGYKFEVMLGIGQINGELIQIQSFSCHEVNGEPVVEAIVVRLNLTSREVCHSIWQIQMIDWNPKIK